MFAKLSLWFALLGAPTAMAAQDFLLGVNYSELIPTGAVTVPNTPFQVGAGTDSQGAVYLLVNGNLVAQSIANVSYLMKLTPAGDRVVYQNALAFHSAFMAVH